MAFINNKNGFKKVTVAGKSYLMDQILVQNLDNMKKRIQVRNDCPFMIDGLEGSGKTTGIGFPVSHYLSEGKFSIKDVVFTPEQFEERYNAIKGPGEVILWDEFVFVGLSKEVFNDVQIKIQKILTLCRKKGAYIIFIVPNFYIFSWYFSVHRTYCLIHLHGSNEITRDHFYYYNREQKRFLWQTRLRYKDYILKDAKFRGNLPRAKEEWDWNFYPKDLFVNMEEYEAKKDESISILLEGSKHMKETKKMLCLSAAVQERFGLSNEAKLFLKSPKLNPREYADWIKKNCIILTKDYSEYLEVAENTLKRYRSMDLKSHKPTLQKTFM